MEQRLPSSPTLLLPVFEALADLKQSAKKFAPSPDAAARRALDNKIRRQRHDVRHLRDASLWNHSFDSAVLLLARAVCALHARLRLLFGPDPLLALHSLFPDHSDAAPIPPSGPIPPQSTSPGPKFSFPDHRDGGHRLNCGASPGRLFMDCLSLTGSSAPSTPLINRLRSFDFA